MINENRGLPVAEGKKLVRKFEDRLEEVWLIDNYKVSLLPTLPSPLLPSHRCRDGRSAPQRRAVITGLPHFPAQGHRPQLLSPHRR